jgi:hypothetical protein
MSTNPVPIVVRGRPDLIRQRVAMISSDPNKSSGRKLGFEIWLSVHTRLVPRMRIETSKCPAYVFMKFLHGGANQSFVSGVVQTINDEV